ncbi:MAG: dephospho-CoA kinase [bacterium]|nr:dephospho-CoA kinase [bacterium]
MKLKTKNLKLKTLVIGITGGLATGKSTVADILHELTGAPIIDADKIGHGLMKPGSVCIRKIIKAFGKDILKKDGSIDRKILGKIVFCSAVELKRLENILHPAIISEIIKQIKNCKRSGCKMVILDAPLLIETGLLRLTDKLIVVSSSKSLQIGRFAGKDKNRKILAQKIIAAQMRLKEKVKFADFHIKNNLSKIELKNNLKNLLQKSLDKFLE